MGSRPAGNLFLPIVVAPSEKPSELMLQEIVLRGKITVTELGRSREKNPRIQSGLNVVVMEKWGSHVALT